MRIIAKLLKEKRFVLLHLLVMTVLSVFLLRLFYLKCNLFRYEYAVQSVLEEENTILDMAEGAYMDECSNKSILDEQDRAAAYRGLTAAMDLLEKWEMYHAKPEEKKPEDGMKSEEQGAAEETPEEVPEEVPESMQISIRQLLQKIRGYSDCPVLVYENGEKSVTARKEDSETAGVIPAAVREQLEPGLKEYGHASFQDGPVTYYGVREEERTILQAVIRNSLYDTVKISDTVRNRLSSAAFGVDDSGSLLMLDLEMDQVLVSAASQFYGCSAKEAGIPDAFLDTPAMQDIPETLSINGTEYITTRRKVGGNILALALLETGPLRKSVQRTVWINVLVFAAVLAAVFLYAAVQLTAGWGRGRVRVLALGKLFYIDRSLAAHMVPVVIAGLVLIQGATTYAQELVSLSLKTMQNQSRINQIALEQNQDAALWNEVILETQTEFLKRMELLNDSLDQNPGYLRADRLTGLADKLELESVDIYSGQDYALVATTSRQGGAEKESDRTNFDEIMKGTAKNRITVLNDGMTMPEDGSEPVYRCEVAVRRTDGSGVAVAVLSDRLTPVRLWSIRRNDTVLYGFTGDDEIYIMVNGDSQTVYDSSVADWMNLSTAELEIPENVLKPHYTGFQTFDRARYFISEQKQTSSNYYEILGTKESVLLKEAVDSTRGILPVSAAFLFTLLLFSVICPGSFRKLRETPTGAGRESWADGWDPEEENSLRNRALRWHRTAPADRYRILFGGLMLLIAFFVVFGAARGVLRGNTGGQSGIVNYIISGDWDEGVNVFAFTDIILLFCVSGMTSWLVRWSLRSTAAFFGRHTETVADMLDGFIRYIFAIAVLIWSLKLLGVRPSTLATGAGIISVVIGIGAQSVVGDILTGIFIVVDNVFSKGDIIEVDGWRGRVTEIGVRTTKVRDIHGDVKIFNNSAIRSVINKSAEYTSTSVLISISYDEDLERAEEVLRNGLKGMQKKIPQLTKEPVYFGVQELGDSSVVLSVTAVCKEEDIFRVKASMRRELKLLFDENGIEIPFPQLVVHQADK